MPTADDDLLTTEQAAELLQLTPRGVLQLARRGQLDSLTTTDTALRPRGGGTMRLFRRADVDRYAAERAARREKLATQPPMSQAERSRRARERRRAAESNPPTPDS